MSIEQVFQGPYGLLKENSLSTKMLPQPEPNAYDNDPIMEEKRQIVEDRKALKEKTIQQKERAIPGAKLLKKLDKQRRLENSLVRVVKDLSI